MADIKPSALAEANGKPSAMRRMCAWSLATAITCGLVTLGATIFADSFDPKAGLYMVAFFGLGAFAPKSIQKIAEQNMP